MGCYPLAPKALSYPELFPRECLWATDRQLVKRLKAFCKFPERLRARKGEIVREINPRQYHWERLKPTLVPVAPHATDIRQEGA